jgi:hypothetical protein
MLKRIDQLPALNKLLARLSNLMARQRGLPVVIGIFLVVISFGLQLINVYPENKAIEFAGIITHNAGVLIALLGLLLANPLGR